MQRIVLSLLCLAPLVLSGCGRVPKATKTRDSGQSGLMDETYAGQNKCNPKRVNSPFIIEWDATDMSSFESYANSDVVFVNYVGCELTVLDACRNDSIRGEQGAYKPVEWTAGGLEKIDIKNEGELYAKLPLGSATLGGRVAGGEHFLMEYYVAGTRTATRDAVYRDDIARNPGCKDATHYVYAYALGAFALGTSKKFSAEAGGSAFGFGVGGKTSSDSQVDKKGGDLGVCKSDSATEVAGCKAPIRLFLREVYDGTNPEQTARTAEDTAESLNLAGIALARQDLGEKAAALLDSAIAKMNARDGKGCLDELGKFDKADPKHKSTDPNAHNSWLRASCLMISGKCNDGKVLLRKNLEKHAPQMSAADLDNSVSYQAQRDCQGGLAPRDALLKAIGAMQAGMAKKQTLQYCADNYATIKKHRGSVKPIDEDDQLITGLPEMMYGSFPQCFAKAGDCAKAWEVYQENAPANQKAVKNKTEREYLMRSSFEGWNAACKSEKTGGAPLKDPGTQIRERIDAAVKKTDAGDGAGCLAELDALKALDPATEADLAYNRGQCEMLSGKCQAGKARILNFLKKKDTPAKAAEGADAAAMLYCKGGDMSDRDKLVAAITALGVAVAAEKKTVAGCKGPIDTIKSLVGKVKPRDDSDPVATAPTMLANYSWQCVAGAGDCAGARKLLAEHYTDANTKSMDAKAKAEYLARVFETYAPKCRGK